MEITLSKTIFFSPPFYLSGGYEFYTLKKSLLDLVVPLDINFKNTSKHLIICTDGISNYILAHRFSKCAPQCLYEGAAPS
jgi:hypothetical protein